MRRRDFAKRLAALAALSACQHAGADDRADHLRGVVQPDWLAGLPTNIASLIKRVARREPSSLNTDWDGTMAVEGLLRWSGRGFTTGVERGQAWFEYHLTHDHRLSDTEFWATYRGPRSRVIRDSVLPFTMYSGFFGLPFPCYELFRLTGDARQRQLCLDVADAILHLAAREKNGLILHDDGARPDGPYAPFTIPDSIYFAARALMIASVLDEAIGGVYLRQAVHQIRTATEVFLDERKGLARTVLTPAGTGRTYWCRASGWLMYALTAVLRYLPPMHVARRGIAGSLQRLADGVTRFQGPGGGLHVLIDQPDTPEETTSTAMCVAAVREASRHHWIPDRYGGFLERGWRFIRSNVKQDGTVRGVYTGWAKTAEQGKMIMDQSRDERGWIPATIMFAADEMTRTPGRG